MTEQAPIPTGERPEIPGVTWYYPTYLNRVPVTPQGAACLDQQREIERLRTELNAAHAENLQLKQRIQEFESSALRERSRLQFIFGT